MTDTRSCTCHPDDSPPSPCQRKFSLTECKDAEIAALRAERDAALKANAIFKKREAENMEREFVLEQQRDAARADALALAAERNNWQSMYQDAMAERDALLRIESAARTLMDESSEYELDDDLGRGAEYCYWNELEGALSERDDARAELSP